jgi:hypothetical protein
MKIPRQPNRPNQSRIIFRADRDLRVDGFRRNEPMATLTRAIRWSPWLCRGGESGWTERFGGVTSTTYVKIKIIWYPFFCKAHCSRRVLATAVDDRSGKPYCISSLYKLTPTYKNESRPKSRPNKLAFAPFIFLKDIKRIGKNRSKDRVFHFSPETISLVFCILIAFSIEHHQKLIARWYLWVMKLWNCYDLH